MRITPTTIAVLALAVGVLAGTRSSRAEVDQECGTRIAPDRIDVALYLHDFKSRTALPDGERYDLQVETIFLIVRRNDGSGGLDESLIPDILDDLNDGWAGTGMQFFQAGPIVEIWDTGLYEIDNAVELELLKLNHQDPGGMNIFFVEDLVVAGQDLCGISSYSFDPVQGIVVANACTAQAGNHTTVPHEVGHFFDLYHTHDTAFGEECPDGWNCEIAGDLICDTPADPNLGEPGMMDSQCNYTGTAIRCGDPFNPDTGNLMSYASPKSCRDHFSSNQGSEAVWTLIYFRTGLIGGGLNSVAWVDFGAPVGGIGTYSVPFNSVAGAMNGTAAGGTIVFKSSTTDETGLFDKPMLWDSFRGSAIIGH